MECRYVLLPCRKFVSERWLERKIVCFTSNLRQEGHASGVELKTWGRIISLLNLDHISEIRRHHTQVHLTSSDWPLLINSLIFIVIIIQG